MAYRTRVLRLHDTAVGAPVDIVPREPGAMSLYVCGPTVDNVAHVGHGRSALVFDVLRRHLEWSGYRVRHVMNVTDVDDKVISRAAGEGVAPEEVARRYEGTWWEDMDRLGVLRPTVAPRATEFVGPMVEAVERLIELGAAYRSGGNVYLEVARVRSYGLLARQPLDSLRAGARVEVDPRKRSPLDFALWKEAKDGEPAWEAPFGRGRPGWHTECVVMSLDLLGEDFDIHGGGQDLAFPHHENERAQALALGRSFARHWVHHGFVEVSGEKMSKSLGNFTSLADLLDRTDGRAYRLLVLRSHYRSPLEVNAATIRDAEEALARLDAAARRFGVGTTTGAARGSGELDQASLERFRSAMDDDLDTPRAVAVLFEAVRRANASADAGDDRGAAVAARTVASLASAVGLFLHGEDGSDLDPEVADLVARRDRARRARDFAAADALRDELVGLGFTVEDTALGTRVRR